MTIEQNHFDDDLIEKSLMQIEQLWGRSAGTREFVQVQFGKVDLVLGCLANADEGVLLHALKALHALA